MTQDIFDFNLDMSYRVNTLLTLSSDEQYEAVRRLLDIYRISKSKKIEKFFINLCVFDRCVNPVLKLELLYSLKDAIGPKNSTTVYEAFSNTAFVFACRVSENAGYWIYAKKALMEFVETFQDKKGPRSLLYSTIVVNFLNMPTDEILAYVFQYRKFDFFSHFTQTLFNKFEKKMQVKDQLVLLQTFRENEHSLWSILDNEDNLLRDRLEACDILVSGENAEYAKSAKKVLERIVPKEDYTVNAENVHLPSIARSVEKTVSALLEMNLGKSNVTYEQVVTRLSEMSFGSTLQNENQKRLRVVLSRIFGYNFLKFTTHLLTLQDIFGQVWLFIQKSPHSSELMLRLGQELLDMFDTCSQGYVCRLVNVLSGFGTELGVSLDYEDEIYAIFSTKVNKLLSDAPEPLRDKLLEELTISNSEPGRRANLLKYLRPRVPGVWNEIFDIFKQELTITDLDLYCRKVMMKYEGIADSVVFKK